MAIKRKSGFSLIEMLVVTTVFTILSLIITQSVFLTFRGANKAKSSLSVKENVENAVGKIERTLYNASSIGGNTTYPCDGNFRTQLHLVDEFGNGISYRCLGAAPNRTIASYSATFQDNLTDTDNVDLTQCQLSCMNYSNTPSIVRVRMTAVSKNYTGAEGGRYQIDKTIYLRNY
jgi:prepilin-type N-terminal cleavage/methylation domain-containing protein